MKTRQKNIEIKENIENKDNLQMATKPKKKINFIKIAIIIIAMLFIGSIIYNISIYSEILMRKNYDKYIKSLEIVKNEKGLAELAKINSDIVAWITIKDQNISFPVVKTDSKNKEDYYLNHDFRKHKNMLGCPYQAYNTNILETDNATFIGHSSFNIGLFGKTYKQSIFAGLNNYLYTSLRYDYEIKIETLTETYTYKVFASIKFNVNNEHIIESEIFEKVNFTNETDFNTYISNVTNLSKINNGITASFGDKLLTLFTCNSNLDYRTMIIAKRIS